MGGPEPRFMKEQTGKGFLFLEMYFQHFLKLCQYLQDFADEREGIMLEGVGRGPTERRG